MNPCEMDSGYPDSVNSSPRSRETADSWDAGDSVGSGSRVRLMCSYGGKIQQRVHDNQLSYLGGDTRILAVDRNIRFAGMIGKLSSFWPGNIVSFKYQLPNEDLDALVSVTNDEDMENLMAEYDRLQKVGYRSSRLRLFVFPNQGISSQSSLTGSPEETKRENLFMEALNVCPVSRSETVNDDPQVIPAWKNNLPDFLFGLGGNGVEDDRNSGQRGYAAHETNSKDQEDYMGRELRLPEAKSAPSSPIIGHSSLDSTASAPGVLQGSDQAEMGRNPGRGFKQDSNLHLNSNPADSNRVPVTGGVRKAANRTANSNILRQEQQASEFSVVNERAAPQQPQLQVPIQDSNLRLNSNPADSNRVPVTGGVRKAADRTANSNIVRQEQQASEFSVVNERVAPQQPQRQVPIQEFQKLQLQDTNAWPVDANANPNIPGRKVYCDPARTVNLYDPNMMTRPDSTPIQPYRPQQRQYQHGPSPSDYYMQDQRSHFVQQSYQQMQGPQGDHQSAYQPVYFVHPASAQQPAARGGGGYYNPVQTVTSSVEVYNPETAPVSNPVTTVRAMATVPRQPGSDSTEPYGDMGQIDAPVLKGPTVAPGPVASDGRVAYRPAAPVTHGHPDPYSYQNVSRQVYYTQASAGQN